MKKTKTLNKKYGRRNKSRKMKGGGCGCAGVVSMKGGFGPASFSSSTLSPNYYNPLNDYSSDPNNPSTIVSTRNMSGGKKQTKRTKCKKCGKMMRGGFDAVSSFGTTKGAWDLLQSNKTPVSSAPYDQPTGGIRNTLV
jgi:hypothetical protein